MKSFGTFVRGKGFSALFFVFSFLSLFYVSDRMGRLLESVFHHDFRWIMISLLAILMGYMLFYIKSKKEIKTTLFVEYYGKQVQEKDMIASVKKAWTKSGKKVADIKTMALYVKPEENSVYYVINGDSAGRVEF